MDASGRVDRTQPTGFSFDETTGVGIDDSTPVSTDYKEGDNSPARYKVVIELQPMTAAQAEEEKKVEKEAAMRRALSD
jgi:hypothetical protein